MGCVREDDEEASVAEDRIDMAMEPKAVLLDTMVVSFRYGQRPQYKRFKDLVEASIPAISFITYGECLVLT